MTREIEGPLAPWAAGLAQELKRQGYATRTVVRSMAMARRLSQHLQQQGVGAQDLSSAVINEALAFVVGPGGGAWGERPRSVPWLVGYLSEIGAMPPSTPPAPKWRRGDLVERYRTYLLDERGVTEDTVESYVRAAVNPFLDEYKDRGLDTLEADDVTRFVTRRCRHLSYAWSSHTVSGLRSFLRFALVEGLAERPLAAAVPSVARWSGSGLPQFLTQRQVKAMLATCDRRRAIGRRNYAILVVLSRLGLRSAEVSGLCLGDIDWRAGELVVRGKGNVAERLPLPPDVGVAITAYLQRGRPRRSEREVFLRAVAPLRGLTSGGVAEVARTASERAGVGSFGPHRLRHTVATEMLRRGGSLAEVAQVLRHRNIATTAGYAKVDHLALRGLAMGWRGCTMTNFSLAADDYLVTRRAMGYKLGEQGRLLGQFVAYLEDRGAEHLSIADAVSWATQPPDGAMTSWAFRLSVVRPFARYLSTLDPATDVPPAGLFPEPSHRIVPYIYSDDDLTRVLDAAARLAPEHRADTYRTLICLVAVTGMRVGEAVRLDRDDVNLDEGLLTIRNSKFNKSRQVPVHATTVRALRAYADRRDRRRQKAKAPSFFTSSTGTRLLRDNVSTVFPRLVREAGLVRGASGRFPRMHDLRHTFAVRCVIGWYREGVDVDARLPLLSTFLGHVSPRETYWYLTGVPELLELAMDRMDSASGAKR